LDPAGGGGPEWDGGVVSPEGGGRTALWLAAAMGHGSNLWSRWATIFITFLSKDYAVGKSQVFQENWLENQQGSLLANKGAFTRL
jgi:hypothetical protein